MSFLAIGATGAVVGAGAKIYTGLHQNSLANGIHPDYQAYQYNPYAKEQLGTAQQLFNGRMAGAGNLERNIASSQANQYANIGRNATDSSTALALGSAAQGQANSAYNNLQTKEAQNKYSLLDNLNAAYAANIREGDKVYQDKFQKFQLDSGAKAGLRNSGTQNLIGGINDIAAGAFTAYGLQNNNGSASGSNSYQHRPDQGQFYDTYNTPRSGTGYNPNAQVGGILNGSNVFGG